MEPCQLGYNVVVNRKLSKEEMDKLKRVVYDIHPETKRSMDKVS